MNARVRFFLLTVLGLTIFALSCVVSCSESKQTDLGQNIPEFKAPDFSLKDINGRDFTLSAKKGNLVLLIFTTTWCPTCRSEISHYKSIHETYSQRGLEVVNIDAEEPKARVSRFASKYRIPYRVLLDETGDVAGAYDIFGIPTMVLISRDGKILSRQYSAIDTILEILFEKK
ncbi:MAG TPA: TlpA disulfide reductase family protein [Syntrophales bacterium]|nr:TlpA disulfide reductase family protein [Syntrophales bacterium]